VSDLAPDRVLPQLEGALGRPYHYLQEVTSTQDVLRHGRHPHGAAAVAEHQSAGRGRSGRSWEDAPSRALLVSVLLRPPAGAALPQLSLVAGLAVAEAVEQETGLATLVRWPNDVMVAGRKVAGILLEAAGGTVVCGIGVNVNQDEHDLPPEPRTPATSLRLAAGRAFDRGALLAAVLARLEAGYGRWLEGGLAGLAPDLERRSALRGRAVRADGRRGTAREVAPDGRLTVVLDGGETLLVESGEVELLPD
jgi:BirA family biotin operon repressor/biotin-[acetyl-CoA-carboxylase] ligase